MKEQTIIIDTGRFPTGCHQPHRLHFRLCAGLWWVAQNVRGIIQTGLAGGRWTTHKKAVLQRIACKIKLVCGFSVHVIRCGLILAVEVALASTNTFSGSVVRGSSEGEGLPKVRYRRTPRFGHLCSQGFIVCGSAMPWPL